ncbi:transglycosylase SLT domain-containing protein [Phyllobacterium lublinensis]|uniref:transglycosylase SLT domain-containing protein n=1 Tax=Phyllobacterium lublinensis TaxID=2875708 RepID=UPI00351CD364
MLFEFRLFRAFACVSLAFSLGACTTTDPKLPTAASAPVPEPAPRIAAATQGRVTANSSDKSVDGLISKYSVAYAVPESLVRRVVKRESRFNPEARNGPYWGLMQLLPATARGLGHDGSAKDLLDAETNLKYGVKYLAGAYKVADNNPDQAVRLYSRGYYYQAKRKGMLDVLEPDATPVDPAPVAFAAAPSMAAAGPAAATTAVAAPTQLAFADERVILPSVVPLPSERQDIMTFAAPATTGGNGGRVRAQAPL